MIISLCAVVILKDGTGQQAAPCPIPLLFYLNSAKMINIEPKVSRFLADSRFHIVIPHS
jgi:hypothetical protein